MDTVSQLLSQNLRTEHAGLLSQKPQRLSLSLKSKTTATNSTENLIKNVPDRKSENENCININVNNAVMNEIDLENIKPDGNNFELENVTPDINLKTINASNNPKNCKDKESMDCIMINNETGSLIFTSSTTKIINTENTNDSLDTIIYDKPCYSLSFGFTDCKNVNLSTRNIGIRSMQVSHEKNETNFDCEVIENSQTSDNDKLTTLSSKQNEVSVNLEIKKNTPSTSESYQSKVLILNTNAIEKLSHVIIQPPHYKSFKRKVSRKRKISNSKNDESLNTSSRKNGKVLADGIKQKRIDTYFRKLKDASDKRDSEKGIELKNAVENFSEGIVHNDMSNIARTDTARSDGIGRLYCRVSREESVLSRSAKMRDSVSQIRHDMRVPHADSPRYKLDSGSSCSPRRNLDSLHFKLPSKTKSNKTSVVREIPHYKIVAGTHFAVDAFCYGEIPGVKNYFLTHYHSDHYAGLKKSFNKELYCSKITAELCTTRLGVNPKCIHQINVDDTITVDGVVVTAIDANHCPGAVMLLFTLPNGKTLLHTGDFRATPTMESHPSFWNNDIHTIYLDTTYCNPRYDFPTQEQSLEMAVHILRQKKTSLEKVNKKFDSVLIVCGTYTIGKEKFFLGLARRVGCKVWACPEKDKVLQTVEGRSFGQDAPHKCQMHVVPMRDLTHEKLRCYLESLNSSFSEVVAFKPSGWENGKNTPLTKDMVTIHGVPYSEHSSFSEMIRFVKYLKPKQVIPTVDISGGVKAVQKHFPCPLVYKEDVPCQSKFTDFFNVQNKHQISAAS